jgi:predicted acetyltransferase
MTLRLAEPDPSLQASYLSALAELQAEGNRHYLDLVHPPGPGFPRANFTLQTLADPDTFAEFCAYTVALARPETPRPVGWVTGTYLWMLDDTPSAGPEVVGRISLRHRLTPWLLEVAGHIGYAVRPTARRRGHATRALGLMLPIAAAHGLRDVLVTCDEDNAGSRAVIEANGGVLEDVRGGKLRFWIPTPPVAPRRGGGPDAG